MAIVLKGGYVVTSKETVKKDIKINGEIIEAIGNNLDKEEDTVIDISGSYILPGGIDAHTHFDLELPNFKTSDNFQSGTKAAIAGGTTTIIDFVNCHRGQKLCDELKVYQEKVKDGCYCDYSFHMTLCEWNEKVESEIEYIKSKGITSFKMYMVYKDTLQVNDEEIKKALLKAKELDTLLLFHCEDGDEIEKNINRFRDEGKLEIKYHELSRNEIVEVKAVKRLIKIAKEVDYPVFIVHLSSKLALDEIVKAKKSGVKIFVETCPHYLLLDKSKYENLGSDGFEAAKYVMSPPLRNKVDNEALWGGIRLGEIQTLSTDHCSFNYKDKKFYGYGDFSKIPNGIPSVENRMELIYTYGVKEKKISLNKMVEVTSTNPAKIFGLYPIKGEIAVGSHGDLLVIKDRKSQEITQKHNIQEVDYTPYEGYKSNWDLEMVFLRGNKIIDKGEFLENKPLGKYMERRSFEFER